MSSVSASAVLSSRESVTPETRSGEEFTTAVVRGVPVQIPCPVWCEADHAEASVMHLADVEHHTVPLSVTVPVGIGRVGDVLSGRVTQAPFARAAETVFALDAAADADDAELSKTEAHAVLDQLAAHIEALRAVVSQMP